MSTNYEKTMDCKDTRILAAPGEYPAKSPRKTETLIRPRQTLPMSAFVARVAGYWHHPFIPLVFTSLVSFHHACQENVHKPLWIFLLRNTARYYSTVLQSSNRITFRSSGTEPNMKKSPRSLARFARQWASLFCTLLVHPTLWEEKPDKVD